jgi:dipeptidyl aminopeptidase/acylaminoacyl peptidase
MKNVVLFICLALTAAAAGAQATQKLSTIQVTSTKASEIPVETFFKRPQYTGMALSPDGKKLAARVPLKGRNNLVIIDLAARTRNVITSFETTDVADITWINNERVFIGLADGQDVTGRFNYRGQWAINADGSEARDLTIIGANPNVSGTDRNKFTRLDLVSRTFDNTPDMIVESNQRTRDSNDLYRINTKTSKMTLLSFDSPGNVSAWVLDRNLVPRIARRAEERKDKDSRLTYSLWHRANAESKYEKFFESEAEEFSQGINPIAFDFDNKTLYVSSNLGRDKAAIYKYDLEAKKLGELVFEHPLIDVRGGLIFSRTQKKLMGINYDADKPAVKWFDPEMGKLQSQIDSTFPNTINTLTASDGSASNILLFARSEVDPGTYHLYDQEKKALESIVPTREWLSPALMSDRKFITYKARDGMEIPAWVTIPKGTLGKNLPLVVHIHGGPRVRSYYGAQWGRGEAQFLASRGYVVLEPEPRGSTGFGRKHDMAGHKQWGLSMQDDLTDGALHLVKEGIVDKNRMALFGGSYGGYATLQGMVKEADLFKAGVAYVAVSDLTLLQKVSWSDTARLSDYLQTDYRKLVGDSSADQSQFELTSPARNASKVKGPILLVMGSDDIRVPLIHGERMRDALKDAGKPVEWVVYKGEGHGFNKDENVIDFYTRIEKFLAANLK